MELEAYRLREKTSIINKKKQTRFKIVDKGRYELVEKQLRDDPLVRNIKIGKEYEDCGIGGARFPRKRFTYNKYF